jgi:multidrug efflux system membrane fusion protein
VTIVDDAVDIVWVAGLPPSVQIITVGQDFVRDGDSVAPVPATQAAKPAVAS